MGDSMPTAETPSAPEPPRPPAHAPDEQWTAYGLRLQSAACRILGSALYAALLDAAAGDVEAGGPAWAVLRPHATRTPGAALALRFMAAVHRLVLTRRAPALAVFFPSVGGYAGRGDPWPALRDALEEHRETLSSWVALPCQTNEVGRCAALVGGFLLSARISGLPLRLLEIGASAGLNLRWDRYRYVDGQDGRAWGDPASPVHLRGAWDVPEALLHVRPAVVTREGCDPRPLDPLSADGRLGLTASVWGDQVERFERLRGALQVAGQLPVDVAEAPASEWLPERLARPVPGVATVVYHSVVLQYMDSQERRAVLETIAAAGSRATPDKPLFWLRMEPESLLRAMAVRLTCWPAGDKGDERMLATAGAHGNPVRWRDL